MAEPRLSGLDIVCRLGVAKDAVVTWIERRAEPAHFVCSLGRCKDCEMGNWIRPDEASGSVRNEGAE